MKIFRFFTWILWTLLFFVLLGFAFRNKTPVRLHLPGGGAWDFPLVGLLFIFFLVGAVLGVMACIAVVFQQKRRIAALRRELQERAGPDLAVLPPQAGD